MGMDCLRWDHDHTDYECVLWQLLEETFLCRAIDVEVQGLCGQQQCRKGKDGEEERMHRDPVSPALFLLLISRDVSVICLI